MNYSDEIIAKAEAVKAKGSPLTIERICEIITKQAAKDAKKSSSKKYADKWKQRELVANTKPSNNPSVWLAEKNRENAFAARPSSMR